MPTTNPTDQIAILKKIVEPTRDERSLPAQLKELERTIKERLPEALEKNAPPDFLRSTSTSAISTTSSTTSCSFAR